MIQTLALQMPGLTEWIVIGVIGILLFGKRLPEVGKSLGKGIVEFKKGLKGIEDDVETQVNAPPVSQARPQISQSAQAALPPGDAKFDPYTGKPLQAKFDPYTGKPMVEESETHQSA
jgi:sec-independent protein translocase protein TatA